MKFIKTIFLILLLTTLNVSCSLLMSRVDKNIKIENFSDLTLEKNFNLSYGSDSKSKNEAGFMELDTAIFLSKIYANTMVKVEKNGYIPSYIRVPKEFNKYVIIDFIIGGALLTSGAIILSKLDLSSGNDNAELILFGGLGLIGASTQFLSYGVQNRYSNVKKMTISPDLLPFPSKPDSLKNLELEKITFTAKELTIREYTNEVSFERESKLAKKSSQKANIKDLRIDFILNQFLYKSGFVDTLNAVRNKNNTALLDVEITDIIIHKIIKKDLAAIQFRTNWIFKDLMNGEILFKDSTNFKSQLLLYKNDFMYDYFENILTNSFYQLANKKHFLETLKLESDNEYLSPITIINTFGAEDLKQAINSSVAIKTSKSLKSGVIISRDGYLLTELGDINVNNEKIEVILSDFSSVNAALVRFNRHYNIALLKADSDSLLPICIASESQIKSLRTGNEAYSIGVVGNINLGQTLNNGVISGIREIDGIKYIQTDLKMTKNSEGSPVLSKDAKLLSIMTSNNMNYKVEGINFSIPINTVLDVLNINLKN